MLQNGSLLFASPIFFPLYFVTLWLTIAAILSTFGGWRALADIFRAPDGFSVEPGERFRARSIQVRRIALLPASYNNCITLGVTSRGLYLVPMLIFRFLHPALLIPWHDVIAVREGRFLWRPYADVELRGADAELRIYGTVGGLVRSQWQAHTGRTAA